MKNLKFLIVIFLLNSCVVIAASDLRPFKTDYCTAFPEGTISQPDLWKHCCLIHDLHFWAGGTRKERDLMDINFKECIAETGMPRTAEMMYQAVRAGSHSPFQFKGKHWGNGWREKAYYEKLKVENVNQVESILSSGHDFISIEYKEKFLHEIRERQE